MDYAELYIDAHKTPDYRLSNQGIDCMDVWFKKLPTATAGKSFLEVGCGNGLLCKRMLKHFKTVTGIDVVDGGYDRTGYEFKVVDISRTICFGEYDYAVCFDVLEHLRESDALVALKTICLSAKTVILTAACYAGPPMHLTTKTPGWWLDMCFELCPDFNWEVLKVWNRYQHSSPVILLYGVAKEN